jgi:hypothetical protein
VSDCQHQGSFEQTTEIETAEHDGQPVWQVLIGLRCAECRMQFAWRGLNSGQANQREPVTSADGYQLRAPIGPRPTGVVGLLQSAGLEHLLGPDGPRLG